ncbi:hypothetical protein IFM89_026584 [Coptis chinensis]|uniref:Uncharacterized protein n=1 Tax=Coptis chinensis TaxID=261450 RepID=A0A835IPE8_9MAGN|nr:hypothetical protein IFM89_026584 [Coptis chinensis]
MTSARDFGGATAMVATLLLLDKTDALRDSDDDGNKVNLPYWIPHPRTGIYYPKGSERVMEDVPDGASVFIRTHWLRSDEGVDKPAPHDVYVPICAGT